MSMMDRSTYTIPSPVVSTSSTDTKDDDGVMIALLPIIDDWCCIDLPHMTLVYAGTTDDRNITDFNEMAKDAALLAMISSKIQVRVMRVEVFGDTEKVNVLRLQLTPELMAMRRAVEKWNASEFSFKPHCTIGTVGTPMSYVPSAVAFDRILVSYGKENLVFWIKNRGGY